ncbi:MAG: DUF6323 family protein [Syntrophomonadaceae bacterium]|nr:DUF6323 family protein [Syntrophomonadaceae bacterium]
MKNLLDIYSFMGTEIQQYSMGEVLACNLESQKYGLVLSTAQAQELIETRNRAITGHGRVELSIEVLKKIITVFCTSSNISSADYAETLNELVDIFYYMKNETEDNMGDDELIDLMKEFFDTSCRGSVELLKNRELALFAQKYRCDMQKNESARKEQCW